MKKEAIKMYYATQYSSPMGEITITSDGENLSGVWFEGQKYFYGTLTEEPVKNDNIPVLETTRKWLDNYFAGKKPKKSELPLAPIGGEFRQSVWKILCEIPYGSVMTYSEIAKKIALEKGIERMSAQAVGGAVGNNPISIIIPCHRVVGSNGSFTGYAGGIQKKISLLTMEGVDTSQYFIPKKGTAL
jgi:methylated-DNA-[protein]-cysteine S-methyltransferase